jgi:cytochrome c-550 PedF
MSMITRAALACAVLLPAVAFAHGDVAPQPVNTDALPDVGEEWLIENPYRAMDEAVFRTAIDIGASGYNQNCARCHGLEAVSGGLAPDLRYLEAEEIGDEWFAERFQTGYTQDGVTKMPAFGELLGQKAAWAIRSYIETRPDDGAIDAHGERLAALRDLFGELSGKVKAGTKVADIAPQIEQARGELIDIAAQIKTASGAPKADSPASRAAAALDGSDHGVTVAFETLTVGLSNAQ